MVSTLHGSFFNDELVIKLISPFILLVYHYAFVAIGAECVRFLRNADHILRQQRRSSKMKKQIIKNDLDSNAHDTAFSRRSFLKITGIAGGGMIAATNVPKLNALDFIDSTSANPQKPRGQWLPTTCQGCTSWCSKQIYVVDG